MKNIPRNTSRKREPDYQKKKKKGREREPSSKFILVITNLVHGMQWMNGSQQVCENSKMERLKDITISWQEENRRNILQTKVDKHAWDRKCIVLGHMCFTWLRTNVMILCNWLILWQNALYLYLGRFGMCLNTSRNHVSRSSVEAFKSVQENKLIVQIH